MNRWGSQYLLTSTAAMNSVVTEPLSMLRIGISAMTILLPEHWHVGFMRYTLIQSIPFFSTIHTLHFSHSFIVSSLRSFTLECPGKLVSESPVQKVKGYRETWECLRHTTKNRNPRKSNFSSSVLLLFLLFGRSR